MQHPLNRDYPKEQAFIPHLFVPHLHYEERLLTKSFIARLFRTGINTFYLQTQLATVELVHLNQSLSLSHNFKAFLFTTEDGQKDKSDMLYIPDFHFLFIMGEQLLLGNFG